MVVFQVDLFPSTAGEETMPTGDHAEGTKQMEAEVVQHVAKCLTSKPCNIVKR